MVSEHYNSNETMIPASNMSLSQNLTNQPTSHTENPLIAFYIAT
jgi:hypothetical protein